MIYILNNFQSRLSRVDVHSVITVEAVHQRACVHVPMITRVRHVRQQKLSFPCAELTIH